MVDCIIIGAGITGLAAADYLSQQNRSVLILEKEETAGGLLSSHVINSYRIEKFYHHILGGDTTTLEFVKRLNLEDQLIWLPASVGYLLNRTIYKLDTPLDILKFPSISFWDKIRLAQTVSLAKKIINLSDFDNSSAKDWIISIAGENVYQKFFLPLLRAKFGKNMDEISAAWMIERIKIRSHRSILHGEKLGYLKQGLSVFIDRFIEKLVNQNVEIRLNQNVDRILIENKELKGVKLGNQEIYSRTLIHTASPKILALICGDSLPRDYSIKLDQIPFQHTLSLLVGINCKVSDTYWLNIGDSNLPISILIEHTNFYNKIYDSDHILYLSSYIQELDNPIWKKTDQEILWEYYKVLEDLFGLKKENLIWWRLGRGYYTSPVYSMGYLNKMLPQTTPIAGLYTTGIMHSYPERSINDSIRQGINCAKLMLREFS